MQKELPKIKDWYWEKASVKVPRIDVNKRISGLPILYQGNENLCLVYSVLFSGMVLYGKKVHDLLVLFLSKVKFYPKGSKPSQVLEAARELGIIKNYYYLRHLSPRNIKTALDASKVMVIGVWNWWLVPEQGHAMALIGYDERGWKCVNWMNKKKLDEVILPYDQKIEFAVAFGEQENPARLDLFTAITNLLKTILTRILG